MGLFDKLLDKAISHAVDKATNKITGKIEKNETRQNAASNSQSQTNQKPIIVPENMKAHFDDILKNDFSQYTVKENVPAKEISSNADSESRAYTFVLHKDGQAAAAIMLTPHNRYRNKGFLGAQNACKQAGIPFINFFTHFPNERNYVVLRIKSFI